MELLNNSCPRPRDGRPLADSISWRGIVQKCSSSKAVAFLARGAYSLSVNTAKGRERRWRLFSTFPQREVLEWDG